MRLLPLVLLLVLPLAGQAAPKQKEPQPRNAGPAIGDILTNSFGFRFCYCPAGSFQMGAPADEVGRGEAETPQHRVTLAKGFWFGETEVTQSQYLAVVGSNPSFFTDSAEQPVETVSWEDAQAFIQQLNFKDPAHNTYRLPSEAEWEYACRAGSSTPFNTGANITTYLANFNGEVPYNGGAKGIFHGNTMFVKTYAPNPWGLYDMHGNVLQWCEDAWHDNYEGAPSDGSVWAGNDARRVLRGGSWSFYARLLRSAYRSGVVPSYRKSNVGFRVVCVPAAETSK